MITMVGLNEVGGFRDFGVSSSVDMQFFWVRVLLNAGG